MVGKLEYMRSDPNRKGRGKGWYYHRGKGYYSKYSGDIDRKIKSKTRVKNPKYRHTGELDFRKRI